MKIAIITGITGQDAAYLAEFLLNKNYKVFGTYRRTSSVNFWRIEDVYTGLQNIALTDSQLINRWGDHTVHGIMLNHKNEKIKLFPKLEYKHASHSDLIIKNNLLRNLTINSRYNPVSINEGIYTKIKIKIKAKIKTRNKFDFENN